MAKIAVLPDREVIDKFKGILDYYLWCGIPCVRKWPSLAPRIPYPLEKSNQDILAYVMQATPGMSPIIKGSYQSLPRTRWFRWQDWAVRAYSSGIDYHTTAQRPWIEWGAPLRFLITSLNIITLGPFYTLEWDTDISCHSCVVISRDPPVFIRRPKYRRGALWYYDWEVHLPAYECWGGEPLYPTLHKELTLGPPYIEPPIWFFFIAMQYEEPYFFFYRCTSGLYHLPKIPWP